MNGDGTNDQTFENPMDGDGEENRNEMNQLSTGDERLGSRQRRKAYRHTPEQIARLEAAFTGSSVASAELKAALSQELGITPMQVKFWFQNRSNQMKNKQVRLNTVELCQENQRLMRENSDLRAALSNFICNNCAPHFPQHVSLEAHRLQMENAYLQREVDKIKSYLGGLGLLTQMPWAPSSSSSFPGSVDSHQV